MVLMDYNMRKLLIYISIKGDVYKIFFEFIPHPQLKCV